MKGLSKVNQQLKLAMQMQVSYQPAPPFSCPSCLQRHARDSGWDPGTASQGQEGMVLGSHQEKPWAPARQVSGKNMWFPSLSFLDEQERRVFAGPGIQQALIGFQ